MIALDRPEGLGDNEWAAVNDAAQRLTRAITAADEPLVVGCAKELCESVARVAINARGGVAIGDDMPDLITAAHRMLEFQPGEGLATDGEARKIAQSLKTMMLGLAEMRNRHGTGHGRATPSGISPEHAFLASSAATLWSQWALRRLGPYVAGDVVALIRDLDSATFRKNDLARRLSYANLGHLDKHTLSRLGAAIGRRSARGTFVVAEDGIEAAQSEDVSTWPAAYVEGAVMGLLFDANGYLDLGEWPGWAIKQSARLVAPLANGATVLRVVAERIAKATEARRVISDKEDLVKAAGEARNVADGSGVGEQRPLDVRREGPRRT